MNFLKNLFSKLFIPPQNNCGGCSGSCYKKNIKYNVVCDFCGWEGTIRESLKLDNSNDKCPICEESKLSYKL